MDVNGHKPKPRKPHLGELRITCWNCRHRWIVEANYSLMSWGWIKCPECGETNEIGDD